MRYVNLCKKNIPYGCSTIKVKNGLGGISKRSDVEEVEDGFIPQYGSLSQLDGSCSRIWTKAVHQAERGKFQV